MALRGAVSVDGLGDIERDKDQRELLTLLALTSYDLADLFSLASLPITHRTQFARLRGLAFRKIVEAIIHPAKLASDLAKLLVNLGVALSLVGALLGHVSADESDVFADRHDRPVRPGSERLVIPL